MGLQGKLIESVSGIVEKMYQLFVQKDLDIVEINPLGISATGEVMALDGKITANDHALGRHGELLNLVSTLANGYRNQKRASDRLTELNWTDTEGNIGILCNSTCLAATTLDLVYRAKGKPSTCLIVEGFASWDLQSVSSPIQQLQSALQQLIEARDIEVVLVNILSSPSASEEVAEVLANSLLSQVEEAAVPKAAERVERPTEMVSRSLLERSNGSRTLDRYSVSRKKLPPVVIRLVGGKFDSVKERLTAMPVHWMDELDEAIAQAVSLAKEAVKKS